MLQHGKRPTIASRHGMVAAAHPLAAAAGARILGNGGTAFDAAAATAAALNVVEPYMSGLAGRGVATCYIAKERRVRTLDFVAPIPKKFPVDKLERRDQVLRGALGVGAPGNLAGWCELVQTHGRKKLPELFAPAIAIARDGFQLIEFNLEEIRGVGPELAGHKALHPEWSRVYTAGQGSVSPGFVLKQPDLARTLEALANDGPGLLYGGALGQKILDRLNELGGCLTMDDFKAVKPTWSDPVAVGYRGHTVNVPPPPCEGYQYLLTLRILEGFDLARMKRNSADHVDTVLRAIRLAAGVRIATGVPSATKARRDPVRQPRRGAAQARARRQADCRPDRTMDALAGRRPDRREPHDIILDRRPRRQCRLPDAELGQRVRLGRRRAGHRPLPQ